VLISVVIPSYNHARYVAAAVRSVLEQSYEDLELIIIDDGSTDDSDKAIRAAIAGSGRRRTEYHRQKNAGAHAAIMRGLALARGEVLTILNSDDFYEPERIARIMNAVPRTGDFIAFTKVRFIDEFGRSHAAGAPIQAWYDMALRDAARCPTVGYALLRNNISVTSGNLVFTRRLCEKVGGFRDFRVCHDWDFLMRAAHHVEPIYVQHTLMAYRYHGANTIHSTAHLLEEEGVAALNHYVDLGLDEIPPNPLAPGWAHWPRYFDLFVKRFPCWFSGSPMGDYLRRRPPPEVFQGVREPTEWQDAERLGLPNRSFLTDAIWARDVCAVLSEARFTAEELN
jgi:glycosyltransferase involved in cell wall biosynthesis